MQNPNPYIMVDSNRKYLGKYVETLDTNNNHLPAGIIGKITENYYDIGELVVEFGQYKTDKLKGIGTPFITSFQRMKPNQFKILDIKPIRFTYVKIINNEIEKNMIGVLYYVDGIKTKTIKIEGDCVIKISTQLIESFNIIKNTREENA